MRNKKLKTRKPRNIKMLEYFENAEDLNLILHENYFYLQPNRKNGVSIKRKEFWWVGDLKRVKKNKPMAK